MLSVSAQKGKPPHDSCSQLAPQRETGACHFVTTRPALKGLVFGCAPVIRGVLLKVVLLSTVSWMHLYSGGGSSASTVPFAAMRAMWPITWKSGGHVGFWKLMGTVFAWKPASFVQAPLVSADPLQRRGTPIADCSLHCSMCDDQMVWKAVLSGVTVKIFLYEYSASLRRKQGTPRGHSLPGYSGSNTRTVPTKSGSPLPCCHTSPRRMGKAAVET
mmetsp:Transcript_44047/g.107426  ORF Transcript_44047/g.107426 Transcript_44047/m.107426 type:complete len:216 (-) Transcript_44047:186-833(-)